MVNDGEGTGRTERAIYQVGGLIVLLLGLQLLVNVLLSVYDASANGQHAGSTEWVNWSGQSFVAVLFLLGGLLLIYLGLRHRGSGALASGLFAHPGRRDARR